MHVPAHAELQQKPFTQFPLAHCVPRLHVAPLEPPSTGASRAASEPLSAPIPDPESTPLPDPESAPLPEPESVPLPDPESDPLPEPESVPLLEPESAPLLDPELSPVVASTPVLDPEPLPDPDSATTVPSVAPPSAPGEKSGTPTSVLHAWMRTNATLAPTRVPLRLVIVLTRTFPSSPCGQEPSAPRRLGPGTWAR
jgi:hypothetical protein